MSRGTHRLLREGATLVEDPEDVLLELGLSVAAPSETQASESSGSARRIFAALRGETLSAEELATRLGTPLTAILVELVTQEMAGRIARTPGGLYRLLASGE